MNRGIVRPGQRRPFVKPTQAQVEERVVEVENLLRAGPILKSTIIAHVKKKFNVEWRTAEEYLARARARLLLRLDQKKSEHRAESLAFYEGAILDSQATVGEKIRARERIDKLLALELQHPVRIEHSGSISTGVSVEELRLDLATRKRLLESIRRFQDDGK